MNFKMYEHNKNPFGINYGVFYPDNYHNIPLLVYLHGAGERGVDYSHIYRHAVPRLISEGAEIPAVVLCPQCPATCVWDNIVSTVKSVIDSVVEEYGILPDRIALCGSSMGGYGTFAMGLAYRSFFSCICPVSGGGMSWRAPNLRTTPVFAYHGALDTLVPPICSELMVNAINAAGGRASITILEEYEHNDAINYVFKSTDLIEKALSCRREDFSEIPEFCSECF